MIAASLASFAAVAPAHGAPPVPSEPTIAGLSHPAVSSRQPDVTFAPPARFAAGHSPQALSVADLDGDAVLDLVVVNSLSDDISVLRGDGSGDFGLAVNYAVGSDPRSVTVGDFDGDMVPDVAVANRGSGDVSVLLGDGTGGFGQATRFGVGGHPSNNPRSIAAGDLTGDDVLDLAVVTSERPATEAGSLLVLFGDGIGGFGRAVAVAEGPFAGIALADFNGDGSLDLVAYEPNFGFEVLLSDGSGGFEAGSYTAASAISLAVGDFNGDGNLDVVVGESDFYIYLKMYYGDGTGDFTETFEQFFHVLDEPRSIASGDFNADGNLDVAVGAYRWTGYASKNALKFVSILLGDGEGHLEWGTATDVRVGGRPSAVVVGDFNNDAKLDLVLGNIGIHAHEVSVLFSTGFPPRSGDYYGSSRAVDVPTSGSSE